MADHGNDYEERIAKIQSELDQLRPPLHDRVLKLEKAANSSGKKWFRWFLDRIVSAIPQAIGGSVVVIVALLAKDSVDLAIKERQLQLSYVKEMKVELEAMAKEGAFPDDVQRAAVLVATFGQPAVIPLLNELRYVGNRMDGAEDGLRLLAIMDPAAICAAVPRFMDSHVPILPWKGQMAAAKILAAGGCHDSLDTVRRHQRLLSEVRHGAADAETLSAIVADSVPDVGQQKLWLRALDNSVEALSSTGKRQG